MLSREPRRGAQSPVKPNARESQEGSLRNVMESVREAHLPQLIPWQISVHAEANIDGDLGVGVARNIW
jgi:hypothetical protein